VRREREIEREREREREKDARKWRTGARIVNRNPSLALICSRIRSF